MNHSYKWFGRSERQGSAKQGFTKLLVLALTMLVSLGVYAQDRTVTGKVSDANDGSGIPGVSVQVKGTNKGAQTDANGTYKVSVSGNQTLVFSSVGYVTQEVAAGNRSTVDVSLAADSKELEQVVVVGYGTVKKKDAIGAVAAIGTKDFNKGIVTSPEQLMQGRVAGVAITQNNGEPGGAINIRVRGTSSIVGNPNPLFVVDGVPLTDDGSTSGGNAAGLGSTAAKNPLNFLNPEDIASLDILKDASATAIYGSRGANGVIMITTKKGKSGKGGLEYNVSAGFSSITKRFNLLSASEYVAAGGQNQGGSTDWQDQLFRTGFTQQHNLAYGGGDAGGSYRISLGYLDQQGIILGSGIKRFSASFNGNKKFVNDKLTIGISLNTSNTQDQAVPVTDNGGFSGDLLAGILKSNPTMAVYKADGTYNQPGISEPNPMAVYGLSKDNTNTLRALGNINAEIQLFKGLKFKTLYGFDRSLSARKTAFSRDLVVQDIDKVGRAYFNDIELNNTTWSNFFTFDKELGKDAFVNATLGYEYQKFDYYSKSAQATNFRTSDLDLMLNNVAAADNSKGFGSQLQNSSATTDELQSYFGRVQAGFGKFLANATLRIDGSTRFGGNNKYGTFPSVGAAWKLIEEDFVPKDIFSDLKLRVAYGVTGNQAIPHNLYDGRFRYSGWGINADATNINGGALDPVSFANPNLKWEQTAQFNVGLDFSLKSGKFGGSIEYYNRTTKDLLIRVTSAQPAPTPFTWVNLPANVYNKGIEISLNATVVDSKDFTWEVLANGAFNSNKVDESFNAVINTGTISGQGLTGAFAQRIAGGQPLYAWFLREFGGYDENGVTIYTGGDFQKFLNGKSPLPTFTGGLTNNLTYKNFSLSFFFNIVQGNWIYSNNANAFWTKGSFANGRNVTKDVPSSKEGPLNAPDVSTRFLEDGSFIRLQNLSLSYRVPVAKSSPIAGLRLFVTGQNLLTFTSYSGQDPEVNTNKSLNGFNSLGIDYTAYPRARTWTIGANISF